MIYRENKGVTLIALVITIIILLIIASISIESGITGAEKATENKLFSELKMVQHAILERYTRVMLTKEELPGKKLEQQEINELEQKLNGESLKGKEYYKITKNNLEELGITETIDEYIVNYQTGEVYNNTRHKTISGKVLYIYALNDK